MLSGNFCNKSLSAWGNPYPAWYPSAIISPSFTNTLPTKGFNPTKCSPFSAKCKHFRIANSHTFVIYREVIPKFEAAQCNDEEGSKQK
jgi:hypothetical protein